MAMSSLIICPYIPLVSSLFSAPCSCIVSLDIHNIHDVSGLNKTVVVQIVIIDMLKNMPV